ncbi:4Fe-4S dicluster domain-containing protein [Microvirga subterranea]|uniref:Ferredoxin-type protein NapF n=1 Tax=Microvirga subterranea TaxID=186651 RepID=A0A370HS09_9HYPH|nr:4Fe-4S dicluster domain-containing protein [Microvirga subterranea]RDI60721.1 ferredoxin-type protein NapF [Microvirga subterranea]
MAEGPDLTRRNLFLGRAAAEPRAVEPIIAVISQSCLALRGVACMSCRDSCPSGAVRFELALGGARPRIDAHGCTGCGECVRTCPADAIRIGPHEEAS